jgi:hypothetical protein
MRISVQSSPEDAPGHGSPSITFVCLTTTLGGVHPSCTRRLTMYRAAGQLQYRNVLDRKRPHSLGPQLVAGHHWYAMISESICSHIPLTSTNLQPSLLVISLLLLLSSSVLWPEHTTTVRPPLAYHLSPWRSQPGLSSGIGLADHVYCQLALPSLTA